MGYGSRFSYVPHHFVSPLRHTRHCLTLTLILTLTLTLTLTHHFVSPLRHTRHVGREIPKYGTPTPGAKPRDWISRGSPITVHREMVKELNHEMGRISLGASQLPLKGHPGAKTL